MYRVCSYHKDEKDGLVIKEMLVEENRGEVLQITDVVDFEAYCARMETDVEHCPDMLLIDGACYLNALSAVEHLRQMKPDLRLIFTVDRDDVLLKPVTTDKILDCVNQEVGERRKIVSLKTKRRELSIDTRRVSYITSRKHYVNFCQNDILQSFRMKLDECMLLMPDYFIRVHQSCAVNAHYIERFQYNKVELIGGQVFSVSRKYAAQAKRRYRESFLQLRNSGHGNARCSYLDKFS